VGELLKPRIAAGQYNELTKQLKKIGEKLRVTAKAVSVPMKNDIWKMSLPFPGGLAVKFFGVYFGLFKV
jgi:hypothetical protein